MSDEKWAHVKPTEELHQLVQSLWLDEIARDLVSSGTLKRYIRDLSVTGLTSSPIMFDHETGDNSAYQEALRGKRQPAQTTDKLFFELALEDLGKAADLFRPIYDATNGADGWVSLEVSPLLAEDPVKTLAAAKLCFAGAGRPNLFIKIPGTARGLMAMEEAIYAGIPVNVTLLFSRDQYMKAASTYMRAIDRRIKAGLNPVVRSVASIFISGWDKAAVGSEPDGLKECLGTAVAMQSYKSHCDLLISPQWMRLAARGAAVQRLLWSSTGTKDPSVSDVVYINGLAAPLTVNSMPEATLLAFADHGSVGTPLPPGGGDCEVVLERFARGGLDTAKLAGQLQREGVEGFAKSWKELLLRIETKTPVMHG